MVGLDKIIKQILDDANSEADKIMQTAKQEEESILQKSDEECRKIRSEGDEKIEQSKTSYEERNASSAALKKRQSVLAAKQQLIGQLLDKAYEALINRDDEDYFAMIERMIGKFALDKSGEICFSRRDLERMPSDFETKIEKIAAGKGGHLRLSEESRRIDGGFILIYGGVEENCSLKALMNADRERLADRIQELLFS